MVFNNILQFLLIQFLFIIQFYLTTNSIISNISGSMLCVIYNTKHTSRHFIYYSIELNLQFYLLFNFIYSFREYALCCRQHKAYSQTILFTINFLLIKQFYLLFHYIYFSILFTVNFILIKQFYLSFIYILILFYCFLLIKCFYLSFNQIYFSILFTVNFLLIKLFYLSFICIYFFNFILQLIFYLKNIFIYHSIIFIFQFYLLLNFIN